MFPSPNPWQQLFDSTLASKSLTISDSSYKSNPQYASFWVRLMSPSVMSSRFLHIVDTAGFPSFVRLSNSPLCTYNADIFMPLFISGCQQVHEKMLGASHQLERRPSKHRRRALARKWRVRTLLLGKQSGAASVGVSTAFPPNMKNSASA